MFQNPFPLQVIIQCGRFYSTDYKHRLQENYSLFLGSVFANSLLHSLSFVLWFKFQNATSGYDIIHI